MNFFTFTKLGRTLLLLVAVVAVGLSGCGDGSGNPSGGDDSGDGGDGLVGDWMLYSSSRDGETRYEKGGPEGRSVSFRSSGEVREGYLFRKVGNVWVELPFEDRGKNLRYRVVGQAVYTIKIGVDESEEYYAGTYIISGNKLILSKHWTDDDDNTDHYEESTWTRVNVAAIRNSLDGPVYINDSRLRKSAAYDYLLWYSQRNKNDYIRFYHYTADGNGLLRYADNDYMSYYTTGNKLFLVNESCDWDDNGVEHCSVPETFELTYTITGSGRNMQLSINGDIWLPAEYDDYNNSSQSKRSIIGNVSKAFFSTPSARGSAVVGSNPAIQ